MVSFHMALCLIGQTSPASHGRHSFLASHITTIAEHVLSGRVACSNRIHFRP